MAKRRKRRTSTEILAQRTIIEIKHKKRAFLKDVGKILSEALGFAVTVSLAKQSRLPADATPDMRRAARMTRKETRAQVRDAFAPLHPKAGIPGLDDEVGF
jgi:hypothetical protein